MKYTVMFWVLSLLLAFAAGATAAQSYRLSAVLFGIAAFSLIVLALAPGPDKIRD